MSSVDTLVAQMVMRARQVERALHDPGSWKVRVNEIDFPARRVVGEDHITFFSLVDMDRPGVLELMCGDDVVSVRPGSDQQGVAQVAWEFAIETPVMT